MAEDIHSKIAAILKPAINQIVDLVHTEAKQELLRSLLASVPSVGQLTTDVASSSVQVSLSSEEDDTDTDTSQSKKKRIVPRHCVFPGCNKPSKGPRFTFTCDDHMGLPRKEKSKYLAAWKKAQ